ncbi:MAG: replicative DNA helicase [Endomicrobiia bacterium]|nr:replicative DNA helicase [Endomicrobiaceae bacterium]MDD3053780.1 replicative DNA helicase [Endomicrobiaceae bacterium]MDD3922785.1 replicative DNA helicase [Endomicrobiaceae bacterium]MDD5101810.1 replicative DNA helicase [Endomicrobiaceae bacterium]
MSKDLEKKVPPQSIDAEMALIGAMLIEKDAIIKALELVKEEDFYKEVHKQIFGAIIELNDTQSVDVITVNNRLKNNPMYIEVGGSKYLVSLMDNAQTSANVEYYANIVKDKAILRQILNAGSNMVTDAFSENKTSEEILDKAQATLFNISKQNVLNDFSTPEELVASTLKKLEALHQDKRDIPGLRTGFDDLDKLTTGLQRAELVIVAGRPGMGKTTFALNIAEYVAVTSKKAVAIFSLEMAKEALMMRFLASCSRINGQDLRRGYFKASDWPKLTSAVDKIGKSPIYISDSTEMNGVELRASARKLAMKLEKKGNPLELIIIDYLQLLKDSGSGKKFESKQIETAEISRSLKALARDLNIPVIALSQLSRQTEQRGKDKTPMLSDLRDSGAIEQDADIVMFVHREGYYNKEDPDKKNHAEVIISKQRNGPTGTVPLIYEGEYTKFYNRAASTEED